MNDVLFKFVFPLIDAEVKLPAVNFILKHDSVNFLNSLRKLSNLEHRIEFIGKHKNINFYNDSKATNAISAKNAIQSFENIFWILGGIKKKGGLKTQISPKIEYIFFFFCFFL